MFLQMNENVSIENLRNYPPGIVNHLKELLASGVAVRPDANRMNFFDVDNADRTFFIHVSPNGMKVMLLATWSRMLPLTESVFVPEVVHQL